MFIHLEFSYYDSTFIDLVFSYVWYIKINIFQDLLRLIMYHCLSSSHQPSFNTLSELLSISFHNDSLYSFENSHTHTSSRTNTTTKWLYIYTRTHTFICVYMYVSSFNIWKFKKIIYITMWSYVKIFDDSWPDI